MYFWQTKIYGNQYFKDIAWNKLLQFYWFYPMILSYIYGRYMYELLACHIILYIPTVVVQIICHPCHEELSICNMTLNCHHLESCTGKYRYQKSFKYTCAYTVVFNLHRPPVPAANIHPQIITFWRIFGLVQEAQFVKLILWPSVYKYSIIITNANTNMAFVTEYNSIPMINWPCGAVIGTFHCNAFQKQWIYSVFTKHITALS